MTFVVNQELRDRKTNQVLCVNPMCRCTNYTAADLIIRALIDTIQCNGPGGDFYVEYFVSMVD